MLDRVDVELSITRLDADVCQAAFDNNFFVNRVANMAMIPVQPLLDRLAQIPNVAGGSKRLVVVLGQLGDFDR